MVKPGGTRRPMRHISPKFAPLPPSCIHDEHNCNNNSLSAKSAMRLLCCVGICALHTAHSSPQGHQDDSAKHMAIHTKIGSPQPQIQRYAPEASLFCRPRRCLARRGKHSAPSQAKVCGSADCANGVHGKGCKSARHTLIVSDESLELFVAPFEATWWLLGCTVAPSGAGRACTVIRVKCLQKRAAQEKAQRKPELSSI